MPQTQPNEFELQFVQRFRHRTMFDIQSNKPITFANLSVIRTWCFSTIKQARRSALFAAVIASMFQVGCDSNSPPGKESSGSLAANTNAVAKNAEAGDLGAMLSLASRYERGTDGLKKDLFLAFKWYLNAAEAGSPKAMAEVSKRYREGQGVREDDNASILWAKKGAEMNDAEAIYLSVAYRDPLDLFIGWEALIGSESEEAELIREWSNTLSQLNQAAEAGIVDAQVLLGRMLRTGIWYGFNGKRKAAIAPVSDIAVHWMATAADSGSAIAMLKLAQWYQKGGGGLKLDESLATKYWDRVESITDSENQFVIGHRLIPSSRKSYKARLWRDQSLTFEQAAWRAREWLEKAARQGHARAALDLGNMLASDQFGYSDEAKAIEYYLQAAESGQIDGQIAVARAYLKGSGVVKDYAQSFMWALRAAMHPTATRHSMAFPQSLVAYLLSEGLGVEKDIVLAYAWANVSAASGDNSGKVQLASLDQLLSASQIREAQQISSSWKLGDDMKRVAGGATVTEKGASGVAAKLAVSGTGFFVSKTGTLITNFHVAGKCLEVRLPGLTKNANVLATDAANDLAALRVDGAPEASARLSDPAKLRQGQEVFAFGFPLDGYLPTMGNITTGLVSALSGPSNNSSLIQISAPVQQGNSGGPVMDSRGEVVGVVVGKADTIRIAKATGDILQNVNFAVSVGTLLAFLDVNRIDYQRSALFSLTKKPEALAEGAREFTVKVECWR